MEPACQLDEDDPYVVGHGDDDLADGLHRLYGFGLSLDDVDLCDAVHQGGHCRTELLGDEIKGDLGILHCVVEQGGDDSLAVQVQVDKDGCHLDGVDKVGLAAGPLLVCVPDLAEACCPHYPLDVGLAVVAVEEFGLKNVQVFLNPCHCSILLLPGPSRPGLF